MLFCCLWRNVETSCHKHFIVVSRYQQTQPLTTCATVVRQRGVDNSRPVAALTARSEARHWLRIAISAYPTCSLGTEKLEWCGHPTVKKF